MAKSLKQCGTITSNHLKILTKYAVSELVKGQTDIREIVKNFYLAIGYREPESRALLTGNLPVVFSTVVNRHILKNKADLTADQIKGFQTLWMDSINLSKNFSDTENIFAYIEENVINPITEGIEGEEEESDPEEEAEEETEETEDQPDPELEKKLKTHLNTDEETLLEDENETYDYKVSEADAVTNALIHRKGITIFSKGQTLKADYRNEKGQDHVRVSKDGVEMETIPLSEFIDKYGDWGFVADEATANSDEEQKSSRVHQFKKMFEWLGKKMTVAYGNAMDKVLSAKSYFRMDGNTLVPGEIAEEFKNKNTFFSYLFDKGTSARLIDGLPKSLHSSAVFTLEISDYEHTDKIAKVKRPHMNVVVEYKDAKGKSVRMIIANLAPPSDGSQLVKEQINSPEVQAYRENYNNLLKQLEGKNGKVVLEKGTPISRVFLPISSSLNNSNAIYENEKDRMSGDRDKSKKLSLKNGKTLLQSMGFTVSELMIDVHNKAESAMAGQAFVVVSPFHTPSELKKLLKDNASWAKAGNLHNFAIEHNLNVIYLKRKKLSFEDYSNALAGNLNPGRYVVDGKEVTEHKKISAMFNPTQSYYILRRVAVALEAIEEKIDSMAKEGKSTSEKVILAKKRMKLQNEFEQMVVFFFNGLHSHGVPIINGSADLDVLNNNVGIRDGLAQVKEGGPIPSDLLKSSMALWNQYKQASGTTQAALIKNIAVRRFGWFSNASDQINKNIRNQKVESLRYFKGEEGRKFSDSSYLSEGGMTGSEIVKFFDWLRENPSLESIAKTAFDFPSIRNAEEHFPTYNPVIEGKKAPMSRIVPAASINPGVNTKSGTDLNEEFLEIDQMPMMPHVVISLDALANSAGTSTVTTPTNPGTDPSINNLTGLERFFDGPKRRRREKDTRFSKKEQIDREHAVLSEAEAIALTESMVGDLAKELSFGQNPISLKKKIAIGEVAKNLFWLHSQNGKIRENVLRHEIFHKVLNEILDEESYNRVIAEGRQMMAKEYGRTDFTAEEVDEYLAERYESSYGTHGNRFIAKLPSWLRGLFQSIRTLYRRLSGNYSGYVAILEKLEEGGFRFSPARYDHYNGDSRFKQYDKTIHEISMELGWGENEDEILVNGREEFDWQISILRQQGLQLLFQNEEIFEANGKKMLSIKKAMETTKEVRENKTRDRVAKYEPTLQNASMQRIYEYFNSLSSDTLKEDQDLLDDRIYAKTTELMDSLREYAFDFYDFEVDSEEEFDVELDPELLAALDEDAETDAKVHQLADRGALSGVKTMNKKVKFHLSSTIYEDTYRPIDAEKASAILVEVVNKNTRKDGAFDVQGFLNDFHARMKNLSLSPNSLEYKTVKAIWDKYFSPLPVNGRESFLAMANKTSQDPYLKAYYKRHMDVVVALVSAYSTVKVIEFLRPSIGYESLSMSPTNTSRGSEIKNEYNSNFINNNFTRVTDGDLVYYQMNSDTISTLFSFNDSFGLQFTKDAVVVKVNSKLITIPKDKFKDYGSGYTDIEKSFIKELIASGEINAAVDFHSLLRAMGFNISQETSLDFLRANFNKIKASENEIDYVSNILTGYMTMAMEMVAQKDFNPEAKPSMMPGYEEFGGLEILQKIANQRTDDVKLIVREEERGNAETEIIQTIYTPTKFSEFFKNIGDAQALSRIGSGSSFEIIGGAKHTKDKINTPLMERLGSLKDLPIQMERKAKEQGMKGNEKEFFSKEFPNLSSAFYSNSFLDGSQEMNGFFQMQTLESKDNNATKSFLDFNDPEFFRVLLSGALAGKEQNGQSKFDSKEYWHPLEVQADRGYMPFSGLKKLFTSGFNADKGLEISKEIRQELVNVYHHGFNLARNILIQIAEQDVNGIIKVDHPYEKSGLKNIPLSVALSWDISPDLAAVYFKQVDAKLDAWLSTDSAARTGLAENGVWQKIKGKYQLNQLVKAKISLTFDEFFKEEERKFRRFAEKAFDAFSTGNNFLETDLDKSKVYDGANKHFRTVVEYEDGGTSTKSAKLFNFKKASDVKRHNEELLEKIEGLKQLYDTTKDKALLKEIKALEKTSQNVDIMKITHPAVMDMYFNYRVNNLMARQLLYGELHTFNPVKGMEHLDAGYVPEYSKRITGAGTSKINMVFNETILVPFNTVDEKGKTVETTVPMQIAPDGLPKRIDVLNFENVMYDSQVNPSFMRDIMESRSNIGELRQKLAELEQAESPEEYASIQKDIFDIEQDFAERVFKVDDGGIYASALFMSLARNSMGGTEGFPVKTILKLTQNKVDIASGNVDYDKALSIVLTPEYMDEVDSVHELYLRAMYQKGVIQNSDGSTITLWDHYEFALANSKSRTIAEQAVLREYLNARKAGTLISEPAMYVNNRSTTKATLKKINANPISLNRAGLLESEEFLSNLQYDSRDLSEGFGAVLDLTSDITDKDIALSSQMLYLLGIVGSKNSFSVQETYKALEKLSHYNAQQIKRQVEKVKKKYGIEDEAEMVRAWALDVIRSSYEKQGDFGSGYRLSEDPTRQAVSHPLHKNKMFGAISSQINKGIGLRVKGFKGIQLPATNMLFLYEVNTPTGIATMTLSQARKVYGDVDAMIASGQMVKRNLRYSEIQDGKISQTEIISGNFLAKKYKTGKMTLNEIFSLKLSDGQSVNIEASDFQELQVSKTDKAGASFSVFRQKLFGTFKSNFLSIDWTGNIGVKNAIERTEKKIKSLKAQKENLANSEKEADITKSANLATEIEQKSRVLGSLNMLFSGYAANPDEVSLALYEVADVYLEMNRSLYGVMTRIPATGKNSSTVFRVRAFIDSHENGMFVPAEWLEITGSDHDGDSAMMWQFGSNQKVAEEMLESTINILSDPDNAREIFSDIDTDMNYVKGFAKQKNMEAMAKGNGYAMDDLYTLNEVRANNGVGSTMTGSSALVAKTYSYAYITKIQYLALGGDLNQFASPNIIIEGENPASRTLDQFTGMIPEKNVSEKYVYKWLETMTNSAIDNAKHLTMGALNIKRHNSDLHAAMVFLGFSKETVAKFFNHPEVLEVFKKAESYADIGANFYSTVPMTAAVNYMISELNGDLRPSSFIQPDFEESYAVVSDSAKQGLYDKEYILHLLNVLNHYGKDFREIQNVIKVSDQVKGMPQEQRQQFDRIMKALGFSTYAQVKQFLIDYRKIVSKGGQILNMPQLKTKSDNRLINPRLVLALNPNLMASLKNHMDFIEKTSAHLLYSETIIRLRSRLEKMIPKKILSRAFYQGKIDQAFYHHFAGMFLDNKGNPRKSEIDGVTYNLSVLEDRVAYVYAFKNVILNAKLDPRYRDNSFINEATFDGNMVEIKMSHNFDTAQENIMLNDFRRLDSKLKDQVFYFLLLTEGLNFKKHGIVKFLTPETHGAYNAFLKELENNPDEIWGEENMDSFIHNFFLANKEMAPEFKVIDITEEQMGYLGFRTDGLQYSDAKYRPLKRKETFEKSEISANVELESLVDQKFKYNNALKEQLKPLQIEVSKAKTSLARKEETLNNNLALIFDMSNPEEESKAIDIASALIERNEEIALEENPKWSSEQKRAFSYIQAFKENYSATQQRLVKAEEAYQNMHEGAFNDEVDDMIENGTVPVKNRSPYRLVKMWEGGKMLSALYKLSVKETGNGKKTVWQKIRTFNAILDLPINLYRPGKITPTLLQSQPIKSIDLRQYTLLKEGRGDQIPHLKDLIGMNTNFMTKIEEDGSMTSFQLDDQGKVESVQKIKSIVRVIQKAFPGLEIKLVRNQSGIHGTAKGWVHKGVIHINLDKAVSDTPLHEAGHIVVSLIRQSNAELYEKLLTMAKSHPLFDEISAKYQVVGNTIEDNAEETLVTLLGRSQAQLLEESAEGNGNYAVKLIKQFWSELKNSFQSMMESFGLKTNSDFDELLDRISEKKDLQSVFDVIGKAIVEGKVVSDISSRQVAKLESLHGIKNNTRFSASDIQRKINELINQGIVTRTCKK